MAKLDIPRQRFHSFQGVVPDPLLSVDPTVNAVVQAHADHVVLEELAHDWHIEGPLCDFRCRRCGRLTNSGFDEGRPAPGKCEGKK